MATPQPSTLGRQLLRLQALNKPHDDARSPQARQRAEQQAVERFFEDAKDHIRGAIESGHPPSAFILGSGAYPRSTELAASALQTFRWHHEQKDVPADSPYRKIWDQFVAWAQAQELEVHFQDEHDGVGVRSWQCLLARPDQRKLGAPPDVAEEPVVISKALLARFGSAQAYLEHLQRQGHQGH